MSLLSVPRKSIIAWYADLQNETPPLEYAICDGRTLSAGQQDINPGGSYTVPDLRNAFLLGADITKTAGTAGVAAGNANIELAAGAPGPKGTGGENDHVQTSAELAPHTHTYAYAYLSGSGTSAGGGNDNATNTSGSTGSTGSGSPMENRPKYHGVVYIMKVKD